MSENSLIHRRKKQTKNNENVRNISILNYLKTPLSEITRQNKNTTNVLLCRENSEPSSSPFSNNNSDNKSMLETPPKKRIKTNTISENTRPIFYESNKENCTFTTTKNTIIPINHNITRVPLPPPPPPRRPPRPINSSLFQRELWGNPIGGSILGSRGWNGKLNICDKFCESTNYGDDNDKLNYFFSFDAFFYKTFYEL